MLDPLHSYNPFDILNLIYDLIEGLITGRDPSYWSDHILELYHRYGYVFVFVSLIFSSVLIIFIAYVIFLLNRIYSSQIKLLRPIKSVEKKEGEGESAVKNDKWNKIMEHIESENANDWRLAILEADIILGEMLDKMGYRGEGIGEQLKSVEKSDFTTIDDAWEAHKVRNLIAHEGASFIITEREAKRVIELYRKVFEEHGYI